jgi:hypothetical protein
MEVRMRRREVSSALLAAAAGGVLPSSPVAGQAASSARDNPRTPAEVRAGVQPFAGQYAESDIRRYGAATAAADNSAAIDMALLVSSHGGNAAFVPPGVWSIAKTLNVVGVASMFGVGNASAIAAHACDGLTFASGGNYAETGTARFMRDFRIIGSDTHGSTYHGIRVDSSVASEQRVTGVEFNNLYVANFGTAVYLRGLYNSNFENCFLYNNYRGFYFYGQTITTSITNCNIQRGTIAGKGGAWGVSFQAVDGESTQNTHISGGQIYGYDININVELAFELQIEHCDVSDAQSIGIQIISTIGGLWVRDCWIETGKAAITTGILVSDITPSVNAKVNITGNYLNCDFPHPGSQGINIGNSNAGIVVNENQIYGFDRAITLGASANLICKFNTVNINSTAFSASSYAIVLNSLSTDNDIGPNYIVPGAKRAAVADGTYKIMVDSAESSLPVGTPLQFDTNALGFFKGVTYFVASSLGNAITIAAVPGGEPIEATGSGSIGHVFVEPLPLSFTAGTPAGLSFHGRGSFIVTLSGFAAKVAGVVNWVASGRLVALGAAPEANLIGMSTSANMEAAGIPRFLFPSTTQLFSANVIDSGEPAWGVGKLTNTGALVFYATPARRPFATSGRKGLDTVTMTYFYA